jgi:hypothetical protein
MANYRQAHIGIVIRASGEVPFDDDCAPEVRDAIIAHLVNEGHDIEAFDVPGKRHKHLRIKNWKAPAK